jgi:hypothetical protein
MTSHPHNWVVGDLTVVPFAPDWWQVHAPSGALHDAVLLVAAIRHSGSDFEVTEVGRPTVRTPFESMTASVDYLSRKRASKATRTVL